MEKICLLGKNIEFDNWQKFECVLRIDTWLGMTIDSVTMNDLAHYHTLQTSTRKQHTPHAQHWQHRIHTQRHIHIHPLTSTLDISGNTIFTQSNYVPKWCSWHSMISKSSFLGFCAQKCISTCVRAVFRISSVSS